MVGAFLQSVAPNIIDIVGDVLPSNGALNIVRIWAIFLKKIKI